MKTSLFFLSACLITLTNFTNPSNESYDSRLAGQEKAEVRLPPRKMKDLKCYVGEYMYEATGDIISIYTKAEEQDRILYLYFPGEGEIELLPTGEHQFTFREEQAFRLVFEEEENGVFTVLMLFQPEPLGTVKTVRKEKAKLEIIDLATIDAKLQARGFQGVVLVAQGDSILFNKAYGKKNNKKNGFNDIHTIFNLCSITKQFTAAGILKLAAENKLSVADKLPKYFEGVPADKRNITIHQLLTHSSGILPMIGEDNDPITEQDFLRQVFRSDLMSPVGEAFHYSNVGYSLLSLIIEKVSGTNYEAFLQENIFKPAKMHHTGYVLPNWKNDEVANGFINGTEGPKSHEGNWSPQGPYLNLKGNGGLLTKAGDVLRWCQALRDHTVLDKATTAKFFYPHFAYNSGNSHYGYGWWVENHNSPTELIHHSGGGDWFASDLWIYPQKDISIIILSNTPEAYVATIAKRIANFLLAEEK